MDHYWTWWHSKLINHSWILNAIYHSWPASIKGIVKKTGQGLWIWRWIWRCQTEGQVGILMKTWWNKMKKRKLTIKIGKLPPPPSFLQLGTVDIFFPCGCHILKRFQVSAWVFIWIQEHSMPIILNHSKFMFQNSSSNQCNIPHSHNSTITHSFPLPTIIDISYTLPLEHMK